MQRAQIAKRLRRPGSKGSIARDWRPGSRPMNKLATNPQTATPSRADGVYPPALSAGGRCLVVEPVARHAPKIIADIETMLIRPLAAEILSERTNSGMAPSFEVTNIVAWPPRMNTITNIMGTLPHRIAAMPRQITTISVALQATITLRLLKRSAR